MMPVRTGTAIFIKNRMRELRYTSTGLAAEMRCHPHTISLISNSDVRAAHMSAATKAGIEHFLNVSLDDLTIRDGCKDTLKTISGRVYAAMIKNRLAVADVSRLTGIKCLTIYTILRGDCDRHHKRIQYSTLRKIADALNVSYTWLHYGDSMSLPGEQQQCNADERPSTPTTTAKHQRGASYFIVPGISRRIKREMYKTLMEEHELAEASGCSLSTISRILSDESYAMGIRLNTAHKIANALGVSFEYVMKGVK